MPLIATSGALAYNKVAIDSGGGAYWVLKATQTYPTGITPQRFSDLKLSNNILYASLSYGGTQPVSNNYGIIKIAQDFGSPTVPIELNFLESNDIRNGGYKSSVYNTVYLGTDVNNTKILLTGRGTRTTLGNIQIASQNVPNFGGSSFSTLDNYFNIDTQGYVDIASTFTNPFSPNQYLYWFRVGNDSYMDSTGNYYVAGYVNEQTSSNSVNYVGYLTKFNGANNSKIWSFVNNQVGVSANTNFNAISTMKVDSGGNLLIMYGGPSGGTNYIKLLSHNPSTGALNWQSKLNNIPGQYGQYGTFDIDSSNNYYVLAGNFIQKYDSSRTLIWSKQLTDTAIPETLYTEQTYNIKNRIFYRNGVVYVTLRGSSFTYLVGLDSSGNTVFSNKFSSTLNGVARQINSGAGMVLSSNALYLELAGQALTGIFKLPLDGSIPGTGSYNVGGNAIVNYQAVSLTNTSNTTPQFSSGNLTVQTARVTGVADWANYMSLSNTIQTTTSFSLT
jgi:hypothetical protein